MRCGLRVDVVAYNTGRDVQGVTVHRTLPFPGYSATKIGPSLSRLPLWILLLIKTFIVARRTRPDILHGHLHEGALIALIVSRLTGIPWVFDFQGSLTLEMAEKGAMRHGSLPFRFISFFEGFIDRRAPLTLVKSQIMQNDLTTRFCVEPRRIRRVMDGADPDRFSPRDANPALRHSLGIASDAVVLCYLGLLNVQQGTERMLSAIAEVVRSRPDVHLLVIGYPTERWVERAEELGIERNVTFTGQVDHDRAPDYLALAKLALAPKVSETEGNVKIYDYMSMELPVVAIETIGNRELLGDDGYYVARHDPADFAAGIVAALGDRGAWPAIGSRMRRRIVEELSWDAVATRLVDAYEAIAPGIGKDMQAGNVQPLP